MKRDIFRPSREPYRTIYDAFQAEAAKREGRSVYEWMAAERKAVWQAARDYAQQHGMCIPTMDDVERSDRQACGHIDYGHKLACGVADAMAKEKGPA